MFYSYFSVRITGYLFILILVRTGILKKDDITPRILSVIVVMMSSYITRAYKYEYEVRRGRINMKFDEGSMSCLQ